MKDIQEFFEKHKFAVIKGFLDPNLVGLIYRYCITKVMSIDFKSQYDKSNYNKEWDGEWEDIQAPGSYSSYGDILMDSMLTAMLPAMNNFTGLDLWPNYSYWRFYQNGTVLKRHRDRHSCEISTTLCLGYDTSNLVDTDIKDYCWPILIEDITKEYPEGISVELQPGDMIIYKGCDLEHWREKFIGLSQAQVFLHYNNKVNTDQRSFDGRPIVGIPKRFNRSYH